MQEQDADAQLPGDGQEPETSAPETPPPPAEQKVGFLRGLGRAAALVAGSTLLWSGLLFLVLVAMGTATVFLLRAVGHSAYGFSLQPGRNARLLHHTPFFSGGEIAVAFLWGSVAVALAAILLWLAWRGPLWKTFWAWALGISMGAAGATLSTSGILPTGEIYVWASLGIFCLAGVVLAWIGSGAHLPSIGGGRGYFSRIAILGAGFTLPGLACLTVSWVFFDLPDLIFDAGLPALCAAPFVAALIPPHAAKRAPAGAWSFLVLAVVVAGAAFGLFYFQNHQSTWNRAFILVPEEYETELARGAESRGQRALWEENLDEARESFAELEERIPDVWQGPFGLAIVAAKSGETDTGVAHLRRAVDAGRFERATLERMEDLAPLREGEDWEAVMQAAATRELPAVRTDILPRAQVFDSVTAADKALRGGAPTGIRWTHDPLVERERTRALLAWEAAYLRLADSLEDEEEQLLARQKAVMATLELARDDDAALARAREALPGLLDSGLEAEQKAEICWEAMQAERSAIVRALPADAADDMLDESVRAGLRKQESRWKGTPCAAAALASLIAYQSGREEVDTEELTAMYARYLEELGEDAEVPVMASWYLTSARLLHGGVPEFQLHDLDGNEISPASLQGKVVLVDFWATWCGPCVAEIPNLKAVYDEFHDEGFEIVGISLDDAPHAKDRLRFRLWLLWKGMDWPQHLDGRGWETPLSRELEIRGIPTMILLDRDWRVVDAKLRGKRIRQRVEEVLRGKAGEEDA